MSRLTYSYLELKYLKNTVRLCVERFVCDVLSMLSAKRLARHDSDLAYISHHIPTDASIQNCTHRPTVRLG